MIRKISLFLLALSCPLLAFSTDVLHITTAGLAKVQMNANGTVFTTLGPALKPATNPWKIAIEGEPGTEVRISNGIDTNFLLVNIFPTTIEVKNNKPGTEKWAFITNVKITITKNGVPGSPFVLPYQPETVPDDKDKDGDKNHHIGSMVYDAQYLQKGSSVRKKMDILAYYAGLKEYDTTKIIAAYANNKLIIGRVRAICIAFKLEARQQSGGLFQTPFSSLSSLGGLDVTTVADGFARFIVNRAKQELSVTFFDNMKTALSDPAFRDMRTLFPQTVRTLNVIDQQIYNYSMYMQALRESFEKDLAALPVNLPGIVENHKPFFQKYPALEAALLGGCYVASSLQDEAHPGEIIREYPDATLDKLNPACKATLQTVQVFSESLRDTAQSADHYWIKANDAKKILADSAVLRLYLGLVNESAMLNYNSIKFDQQVSLTGVLNSLSAVDNYTKEYKAYRTYVLTMIKKAEALDSMIATHQKPTSDSLSFELYYKYFDTSVDLMEYGLGFGKLPYVNLPHLIDSTKKYFETARTTADLFLDVNRRNYASAVINLVELYNIVLHNDSATLGTAARRQIAQKDNDTLALIQNKVLKYGTFMATIVQAKNSEEVENAIEAFALPAGSARIKRESQFNVSLNSYCGFFGGVERIRGFDNGPVKVNAFGLTAPVGIAVSWGGGCKNSKYRYHSSYSVFFSAVDLGAIAAFRAKNDTVAQVPNILLKDIVSPGLFLSWGIPKVPLSINFGMQIGPNLRNVHSPNAANPTGYNDYANRIYCRYSASICVDIPVLNLYTNNNKRE